MLEASRKSMARSLFVDSPTVAAVSFVNAPFENVTVRLLTSLVLAWFAALPVRVRVTTVSLVRAKLAIRPEGTLLAVTRSADTTSLVNVSPVSVAVTLPATEPSLAAASVKLPASACAAALPVSVRVTSVSLLRKKLALRPEGMLLAVTWSVTSLANVSPLRVAVTLLVTEPSLAPASLKLPT